MKNILGLILFILMACYLSAQPTWTLEEVLQKAIDQNQDIEIAEQKALLEGQKVFKSNVGLTPTVRAYAGGEYAQNNMVLELNNFTGEGPATQRITEDLAFSMFHNFGVRMDYTVYDGGRGKKMLQQLQNIADLSSLQHQLTTDNILLKVTQLYLTVASMEQTEQLLLKNIELSKERLDRAELNMKYAKGNNLSVLRAKTDLNADRISLKNMQRDIKNTKRDLLRVLDLSLEENNFVTSPYVGLDILPDQVSLRAAAQEKNPQIRLAQQGVLIEQQQLEIDESANVPIIGIYGGPNFVRQDFEVNQIKSSQSIGPSFGFSVNYNLNDGKKRKRNQEIQKMQIQVNERERINTTKNVLTELDKAWNNYRVIKEQLLFEQENLPFYEENLSQTQISYKAGKSTDTDIRTAQLGLLSAKISIARKEIELQMEYFKLLKSAGLITTT